MRELVFVGSSRKDLLELPDRARQAAGYGLYLAQIGEKSDRAVPLKGFSGASVVEIRIDDDGETYRAVYTIAFADRVYVLHCFQKKAKRGIATSQREIDLIKQRLRDVRAREHDHD
jgi:phage-related protein